MQWENVRMNTNIGPGSAELGTIPKYSISIFKKTYFQIVIVRF